ncbi:MAG: hypothetical protein ABSF29_04605 [Tepidisphaeraceae bacterium]
MIQARWKFLVSLSLLLAMSFTGALCADTAPPPPQGPHIIMIIRPSDISAPTPWPK